MTVSDPNKQEDIIGDAFELTATETFTIGLVAILAMGLSGLGLYVALGYVYSLVFFDFGVMP